MKKESNGEKTIGPNSEKTKKNAITPTSSLAGIRFIEEETLPLNFTEPFGDLSEGKYHKENLIDASAKHLYALMRGLQHDKPDHDIRRPDPHIVETSVKCASEIRNLLKLKLDVLKLGRELNKDFNGV